MIQDFSTKIDDSEIVGVKWMLAIWFVGGALVALIFGGGEETP